MRNITLAAKKRRHEKEEEEKESLILQYDDSQTGVSMSTDNAGRIFLHGNGFSIKITPGEEWTIESDDATFGQINVREVTVRKLRRRRN